MEDYHGIIIDLSQKDEKVLERLNILGQRKTSDGKWVLYKVVVNPDSIEDTIKQLQENMVDEKYYFHFYKDSRLIVVFKRKIFRIGTDKSTWDKAIEYGKSLGVPEEQLDFYPCRIEDETY